MKISEQSQNDAITKVKRMSCQHWKSTCYVFTAGSKWGRQSWRGFGNGRHRGQTNPWMHLFLPFAESLNLYSCGTRPRQNYPVESWARRINFINHRHSRCTIHYHPTLASTLYIDIIYIIIFHSIALQNIAWLVINASKHIFMHTYLHIYIIYWHQEMHTYRYRWFSGHSSRKSIW